MPSATSDGRNLRDFRYELIFSPIYGVFGSLGLYCLFNYIVMAAFHERYRHPYFAPFCVLAGLASLCICIAVLTGHICCSISEKNKNEKTLKRIYGAKIAIIIALVIVFFIGSAFLWEPLHGLVSDMIKAAEAKPLG